MPKLCVVSTGYKIWNVGTVVGLGIRTDRYDAMLVQFLLNKTSRWLADGGLMRQACDLTQDGIFGARSHSATIEYQRSSKRMVGDGRVSPAAIGDGQGGWDGQHMWTIIDLNVDYARMMQGRTVNDVVISGSAIEEAMQYVPFDEDISPALSASLLSSMATAAA